MDVTIPDRVPCRIGDTRILVTGCRDWECTEVARWIATSLRETYGPDLVVVHGGAAGVDSTFARTCKVEGIADEPHPADWRAHGRAAGPRRNQEMVDGGARFAIAVHRDLANSKGTMDCVRRCLAAGIPVYHVDGLHSARRLRDPSAPTPHPLFDREGST